MGGELGGSEGRKKYVSENEWENKPHEPAGKYIAIRKDKKKIRQTRKELLLI